MGKMIEVPFTSLQKQHLYSENAQSSRQAFFIAKVLDPIVAL